MSKQVKIKRLTLCNFKGLRNVTVEFSEDATTISGRNGTGKTTIKDAFSWLLWGKDSEGNTDSKFGIKTNDANGNFIPDLEHEVSGMFEVIDTETGAVDTVEFRRVLVEEWKVPNGETERVLKGHHTDYFCNGVPLKTKAEYDKRINDIIPEAVFKVITDPYYFLTLHWKAQREMLLQIAGDVSEADVAKDNAEFAALLARVTGKTLEDYKREVAVQKNKISDRLEKIPTAIDAITRVTPTAPDYAALEADKARLEGELSEIDTAASSAAEANRIQKDIANDKMEDSQFQEFLTAAFSNANRHLKQGGAFYIWHAGTEGLNFKTAIKNVGWELKQMLIWVKNNIVLGRQDYQWQHEPCCYGWKPGAGHYFVDNRSQRTVFEDETPDFDSMTKAELKELLQKVCALPSTVIREDKPLRSADHPTMKPLKLMGRLIRNSTRPGEVVLDLFGGSGSTLMAAEQLGRVCYSIELDPCYIDVIIKRWEEYTGEKAQYLGNCANETENSNENKK